MLSINNVWNQTKIESFKYNKSFPGKSLQEINFEERNPNIQKKEVQPNIKISPTITNIRKEGDKLNSNFVEAIKLLRNPKINDFTNKELELFNPSLNYSEAQKSKGIKQINKLFETLLK